MRGGLTSDNEGFKLILLTFDCTSAFDLVSCTKSRRALLMSEEFFINLLNESNLRVPRVNFNLGGLLLPPKSLMFSSKVYRYFGDLFI